MATTETGQSGGSHAELTPFAGKLLRLMAARPDRLEYHTRALGGVFQRGDVDRLDAAYVELRTRGLVEPASEEISFFGDWKRLHKITEAGLATIRDGKAA